MEKAITFSLIGLLLIGSSLITSCTTQAEEAGKCYGNSPCYACKNCSGCAHCAKDGGTCGVCIKK